jgi:hypothetical protein
MFLMIATLILILIDFGYLIVSIVFNRSMTELILVNMVVLMVFCVLMIHDSKPKD